MLSCASRPLAAVLLKAALAAVLLTRGCKRGRRLKRKLSRPPFRGESRELTMSAFDEREATENNQWRSCPTGSDDWMGVWGKQSFPH